MISIPFYEPLSKRHIFEFFGAVANATDLPLMVYNYPYANGVTFDVDLLGNLIDAVPSVRYIKDSGGDLFSARRIVERFGERVGLFEGYDWQSGPGLLFGAAGVINAGANVFPAQFKKMWTARQNGDDAAGTAPSSADSRGVKY